MLYPCPVSQMRVPIFWRRFAFFFFFLSRKAPCEGPESSSLPYLFTHLLTQSLTVCLSAHSGHQDAWHTGCRLFVSSGKILVEDNLCNSLHTFTRGAIQITNGRHEQENSPSAKRYHDMEETIMKLPYFRNKLSLCHSGRGR